LIAVYLRPDSTQVVKAKMKKGTLVVQANRILSDVYLPDISHDTTSLDENAVNELADMFADVKSLMRAKKDEFYIVLPDYIFAMEDCFRFDGESDIRSHIENGTHKEIDQLCYSKPIITAPEPQQQLVTVCVLDRFLVDAFNEAAKRERVQLASIESAGISALRASGIFAKEELSLYSFEDYATFIGYSSNGGLFKMDTPELSIKSLSMLNDLEAEQQIRQYMIEFEASAHQTFEYLNQDLPYTFVMPPEVIGRYPAFQERQSEPQEFPEYIHQGHIPEGREKNWMCAIGTLLQSIDFNDEKFEDVVENYQTIDSGNVLPEEIKISSKRYRRIEDLTKYSKYGILGLLLIGLAEGAAIGIISNVKIPKDLQTEYNAAQMNSSDVENELEIIRLANKENEFPLEAYSAMTEDLPDGVHFVSLSIGSNSNQDNSKWVKAKIVTDDPLKFQDYVSLLSDKPEFKDVSIPQFNTDTSSGYKTAEMTIAKGKVGD
jgi:hypothetical protein